MSYNFVLKSYLWFQIKLARFQNQVYDFRPNCTSLSSFTIINQSCITSWYIKCFVYIGQWFFAFTKTWLTANHTEAKQEWKERRFVLSHYHGSNNLNNLSWQRRPLLFQSMEEKYELLSCSWVKPCKEKSYPWFFFLPYLQNHTLWRSRNLATMAMWHNNLSSLINLKLTSFYTIISCLGCKCGSTGLLFTETNSP